MWNGDDGKGWGKAMRRWGWGQWRCPSEGHGRECGLRPSVQSGVPRCGALSLSLSLPPSLGIYLFFSLPPSLSLSSLLTRSLTRSLRFPAFSDTAPPPLFLFQRLCIRRYLSSCFALFPWSRGAVGRGAARQTARMHQMHRTDRCPSLFYRFHLFTSAVLLCLSLSLRPLALSSPLTARSVCLSRSPGGSSLLFSSIDYSASAGHSLTSFTSLCRRRRRRHSREQSSASLPPCDASSSPRLPRCRIYVRASIPYARTCTYT